MHIAGHLRHARGQRVSQCRGRRSCVSDADAGVLKLHVFGAASRGWGHACAGSAPQRLWLCTMGLKCACFVQWRRRADLNDQSQCACKTTI